MENQSKLGRTLII